MLKSVKSGLTKLFLTSNTLYTVKCTLQTCAIVSHKSRIALTARRYVILWVSHANASIWCSSTLFVYLALVTENLRSKNITKFIIIIFNTHDYKQLNCKSIFLCHRGSILIQYIQFAWPQHPKNIDLLKYDVFFKV